MTRTVDDLRNEIRVAVGRFERPESTAFTKETLAAICTAVGADVDVDEFPSKERMRTAILDAIGELPEDDPERGSRPFRKQELLAIANAVTAE